MTPQYIVFILLCVAVAAWMLYATLYALNGVIREMGKLFEMIFMDDEGQKNPPV